MKYVLGVLLAVFVLLVSAFAQEMASPRGSISGTVTLPNSTGKGNLFIEFTEDAGVVDLAEFAAELKKGSRVYRVIKAEEITSARVKYKIENVPAGEYWGFVVWDAAEPGCDAVYGQGNCFALPGDYTGATQKKVVVENGQQVTGVDMACKWQAVTPKKQQEGSGAAAQSSSEEKNEQEANY